MTAANEAIESGIEIADVNAVVKTVSAGRNQLELATPYHQAVVAEPPCVGTDEPLLHCESGMATGGPSLVGVRRTG